MALKMEPASTIIASVNLQPNGKIQKFFTNTCYRYMDKYVPMREGDLRTNVDIGADYITYESPYATAQYYGIVNGVPVKNYTTPGTGPYWDERMVSAEINSVIKEVKEYARRINK